MTKSVPINIKNSIEAVSFAVNFSRPFDQAEQESIQGIENLLKEDFPIFNKLEGIGFQVTANQVQQLPQDVAQLKGILLQKLDDQVGKVTWQLRVSEGSIQVTCSQYDHWKNVWPKALGYITSALKFLNVETLTIASIGCQIVDKFVYEDEVGDYKLSEIFNDKSEFLTPRVNSAGRLWHIYQGWFESLAPVPGSKLLSQLNLTSSVIGEKLTASIDSVGQCICEHPLVIDLATIGSLERSVLSAVLNTIHENNKNTLLKLLSQEKAKEIGLI
ncbi:MAG: TIGR04255 family protein [Polynucleobacter sp.]|nr:TIGR04255 family protein [Polynucleobacter sp.]OZB49379.1 MAG: hypothetical protein B7X60_01325 [Polynucleobacter sp. 39-45-136]